jgi:hypothetical protein
MARFIRNDRLADAPHRQAQSALRAPPGARAHYDEQRDHGLDHNAALRAPRNPCAIVCPAPEFTCAGSADSRIILYRERREPACTISALLRYVRQSRSLSLSNEPRRNEHSVVPYPLPRLPDSKGLNRP